MTPSDSRSGPNSNDLSAKSISAKAGPIGADADSEHQLGEPASVSLGLDQQLCFALYACSKEITRLYRPMLQELQEGLTYTQYVTLLALWEQDGESVKSLGQRLFLDSGTLTPLLKKLETFGLVRRVRDGADERLLRVFLTDKGRALKEKAFCIPDRLSAISGLLLQEADELRIRLQRLNQVIQHHYEEEI
ncbi:MarR family transcriptional regulator [Paenibacillus pasadenensis]|uniref:MarR family winged helix-turn-helix transcriptional regulator n=1 Tax=Paenibacillus pasadenensis TaxID=217090 RepID=UPI00203C2F22|nr:MarR family transcriptional regulator [Paenibacillus pasadenensis]MCM3747658.1 MarR family transcriptional regulator [Paenibacillus pasadenensis]